MEGGGGGEGSGEPQRGVTPTPTLATTATATAYRSSRALEESQKSEGDGAAAGSQTQTPGSQSGGAGGNGGFGNGRGERGTERDSGMVEFRLDGRVGTLMPGDAMREYLNRLVDDTVADTDNQVSKEASLERLYKCLEATSYLELVQGGILGALKGG